MKKLFVILIAGAIAASSCTHSQVNNAINQTAKYDSLAIVYANALHKLDSVAKAHEGQIDSLTTRLSKVETKK